MSGELTLDIALQRVESNGIKERAEGLKDLKHVLRNNSKFDTLSDVAFHRIYEVLFGVAVMEKSTYLKSKTTTTRSAAESRLSDCASGLRLAVEVGTRYVRAKTVRSVLDHVIETATLPNAHFCEPIALDYLKCMRALLTYQPHVEHLTREDRERTAAFCVECIKIAQSEIGEDDAGPVADPISLTGTINGLSYRSSRSHHHSAGSQSTRSLAKSVAEETTTCLSLLTAAPNASPGTTATELLASVVGVLQRGSIAGASRQDAFATINNILTWIRTENIDLTQKMTSPLLRLVRNYWTAKTTFDKALFAFRNEMLVTLIHIRPYIFAAMYHGKDMALRSELSGLADVLRIEYGRRSERDQLRLEDIRLRISDSSTAAFGDISTVLFRLRSDKAQPEACWTISYILASLTNALQGTMVEESSSDDEDDGVMEPPRKRQRMTEDFDELLAASMGGALTSRVCALQTLTFLAQQRLFSSKQLAKVVEKLTATCADDNGLAASWAMLALASVASQIGSTKGSLSKRWLDAWQIVVRALTNVQTCRAASHLVFVMIRIRLVSQQAVADLVQTMTSSMDLNGPSMLADSVLNLLGFLIKTSQQINPATSNGTAESVLAWLFRNFRPSRFADRDYASQQLFLEPQDVISLINSCLGQDIRCYKSHQYPTWDVVGQALLECAKQLPLLKYLLLLPEIPAITHAGIHPGGHAVSTFLPRSSCEVITLNHLIGEMQTAGEEWNELVRDKPQSMSVDVFATYSNSCLIATCIAFCCSFRDSRRQNKLQSQTKDLLRALGGFIMTQSCPQEKVDTMLAIFSPVCGGFIQLNREFQHPPCELPICRTVSKAIAARSDARQIISLDEEEDDMDTDIADASQASRQNPVKSDSQILKGEYAVNFSLTALRTSVVTYATVVLALNELRESAGADYDIPSGKIVDYVLSLSETSFILSANVLSSMSDIGIELTVDDCYRLFDHCADRILWPYTFERNEVALTAVLEMMSSFAAVITNENNKTMYDLGVDMYNWYAAVALKAGVLSPAVQERVASLLLRICHVDTDYGRDDKQDIPSVRTSLFKLIELGTIRVKFNVASGISSIFGLYVLSTHPDMFEDLQMSLPDDVDSLEGMAMRLLFFSKLASAWHSLLRQCVFYIFETAGRVKSSSEHAARSMADLSAALRFDTPQRLFQLFAPQILHTWLQRSKITSLPFEVFNYDSLEGLILQNQGEITAQLVGHGDDAGLQVVMEATKLSSKELVARNFAKCEAYCLGWDIATSPSSPTDVKSENRLKALMESKEEHRVFVTGYFAAIMGHLFLSLQQDDAQDSWLEKRSGFTAAAKALADMRTFSYSDRTLPMTQEPCFKNKYLGDEIERLCRRAGIDPVHCWDSSSFALAARMLLDSIEHALGPLHTCLVVRKLRLLVGMAGDIALSGFPLELLIHSLRPFLGDSQCADDVIGVLQYLFQRGQYYLRTDIPFLTGTVVLMILQMRKHSGMRTDSTTQEGQHKATVQKMQRFQSWLVDLLKHCQTAGAKVDTSIADTLMTVNLPGNARKDSPESALLLHLLDEDAVHKEGMRSVDRNEALVLLSESFEMPQSVSDDCLGSDADCARLAQSLFNVIHVSGLSDPFKEWAARALGRAYACTGIRPLVRSQKDSSQPGNRSKTYEGIARSQATIAARLAESLFSRGRAEASLADYTLRSIFMTFKHQEDAVAFQQMLPSSVVDTVSGGTYGYDPSYASEVTIQLRPLRSLLEPVHETTLESWAKSLSLVLCRGAPDMAIFPALAVALHNSASLALKFLPCIIHTLLASELDGQPLFRTEVSNSLAAHFGDKNELLRPKQRFFIELLLYLREQPLPGELTHADRLRWLEVDWLVAAQVAQRCGMSTTALIFAESSTSSAQSGRRSSSRASLTQVSIAQVPQALLLSIFKNVEETDSFYGVEQPATLESVLDRLDYEADGYKSLMFRTAQRDTLLRSKHQLSSAENTGIIRSLSMLNLNSLTFALLNGGIASTESGEDLLNVARDLQRWDIMPLNDGLGATSNSFSAFQELSRAIDRQTIQTSLRALLHRHINPFIGREQPPKLSHDWFSVLASFTEISEIVACNGPDLLRSRWAQMEEREAWMSHGKYEDYQLLLSNRHTMFSVLAKKEPLLKQMRLSPDDCHSIVVKSLLDLSRFARQHGQLQQALAASNQCNFLIENSKSVFNAEIAAKVETASVLWDMGEVTASISMLQAANALSNVEAQDISVGRAGLLAQLAHQLAEARLEKPDEILDRYLKPAIAQLSDQSAGREAGKVFHEFATFCDKQLQNPNSIEDFNRIAKLRQRKLEELEGLQRLSRSSARGDKEEHLRSINKAKQWYDIDNADYDRLKNSRDTFILQSMQNYLQALSAADDYDISVLRFFTLWLEHADVANASKIVSKHLPDVPSWKFAVLLNQLMSRLELDESAFQASLKTLVTRLCSEHPYHGLHHLFAATRRPTSKDEAAVSRYKVANDIRQRVKQKSKTGELLENVFMADRYYQAFANRELEKGTANKILTKDIPEAVSLARRIPTLHVPPATMSVPLQPDGNYSGLPEIVSFSSTIALMNGLSRPKKLTAYASNGESYTQLFKGPPGKDDLRQDAIMEQVFGEVSKMLQNHKATRQRNLHVRTYKVIPLSATTGIIEFVPNSISLLDFLSPAHERYHPQDYKNSGARSRIEAARSSSADVKVKEYQKVCDHIHPVLRHFFFERFKDPDEWFEKRTAYTRTTATISILGYVLGLGDRHCQNIMLDEKSGEVVHIDLGVAFEAGRVLPVPELVPFRLSRDIVDGMGITKTEGVFRRCCEFTMDALRDDKDSIMTLLNVLRYDPLYTWTVSPLRAKRMQEATGRTTDGTEVVEGSFKKREQDAGEADRALSIVEKKLSKTLSTAATVNELIQQATEVRNLATLFSGWAAYF